MSKRILYTCRDSPPGRAVQMALKYLDLRYTYKEVDFDNGEHFSEDFLKMYPQGEIPVLDDGGHIIGESIAIIQYLAEKYPKDKTFYPSNAELRSIVHHRLAFHLSTFYRRVHDYVILPMDYPLYLRSEDKLKLLKHACQIFNEFLKRSNSTYVAGEYLTISDLPLVMATLVLEADEFDLSPYPFIKRWIDNFKVEQKDLWVVAKEGYDGLAYYLKNPRDLSHLNHPIHPTK